MKCASCNRQPSFYFKIKDSFFCYFCIPSYDDYEIFEDTEAYLQLDEKEEDESTGEQEETSNEDYEHSGDTDVANFYNQLHFYDACVYNKFNLFQKTVSKHSENQECLLMGLRLALKYENIKIATYLVNHYFKDLEVIRDFVPQTRLMQAWFLKISTCN